MNNNETYNDLWKRFIEIGFLEDAHLIHPQGLFGKKEIRSAIQGGIRVQDKKITLRIGIDNSFPLSLPYFLIHPWNALGFIPHVEYDGTVCYAQKEGLVLDRENAFGILEESFKRTIAALEAGYKGENKTDFIDEFEAYWLRPEFMPIKSIISPTDSVKKILIGKYKGGYAWALDDDQSLKDWLNGNPPIQCTYENGLYVPLKANTLVFPPPFDQFWSEEDIRRAILPNLTEQNLKLIEEFTHKYKNNELIVFMQQRPSGDTVLFGVFYKNVEIAHPLRPNGKAKLIIPVIFNRHDKDYLLPRGGGKTKFNQMKIMIIGCGAVGGHIAFQLAREGVMNLTLVDPDKLSDENIYRHVLGRSGAKDDKVEALKKVLQINLPYIKVIPLVKTIGQLLAEKEINFFDFDLIIIATGDPTANLLINEFFHSSENMPPSLFTWLDPYGIGGHCLVSDNKNIGCYNCLYKSQSESIENHLSNRASFAAPGQFFAKTLSGCGSLFVPYGSIHSEKTALLATEIALDILEGRDSDNPLLSWKGRAEEFQKNGFVLSPRYNYSEADLFTYRYEYKDQNCPICNGN